MRDSRGEALRWLRQAENDLAFARLALREGFFAQACFVAQQTAEKALKAVAYGLGERLVVGHSLVELLARLDDRVPALADRRERAGVLDQYYVATRYPNGLPGGVPFEAFSREQAERAVEDAEGFVEAARAALAGAS
jgi:HEPN domain-containing protein